MKAVDEFLKGFDQLIRNANNRNIELSGELTFIKEQDCDVDISFARNLEAQAYRVHGELMGYEKIQKLCERLMEEIEEEEDDDDEINF